MVTAAVTELELVGLRTVSQGDHLVTEADTEDRKLTGKCFYRRNNGSHILRVSGAVRKEDSVRLHELDLFRSRIIRNYGHVAAVGIQFSDDVELDAAVDRDNVELRVRRS